MERVAGVPQESTSGMSVKGQTEKDAPLCARTRRSQQSASHNVYHKDCWNPMDL